jgi:hypothetical protein
VRIEELLPLELLQRGPDGDLQDEVSFEALGYERAKA